MREWLEDTIKAGCDVFMIVGIRTVSHATITCRTQISSKVGGSIQVPVIDIVTSGVTALTPGEQSLGCWN